MTPEEVFLEVCQYIECQINGMMIAYGMTFEEALAEYVRQAKEG